MNRTVTADGGLNVRTGPGTAFVALPPKLQRGAVVEVVELDPGGSPWVRVARGWVHGDYLAAASPAPAAGWRLAGSLQQLLHQVNALAPTRSKSHDGTIGDAAHAARKSDHNPNPAGVVTALDITHDPARGCDCRRIADHLVASRDPRIKYLIFQGQIVSSLVYPWAWRPYTGPNKHLKHLHVSVDPHSTLYDDARPWAI